MSSSILDALSRAVQRTRLLLVPFRLEKWLHLAFIAFVAQFAAGSAPSIAQFPNFSSFRGTSSASGSPFQDLARGWSQFREAVDAYWWLVLVSGVIATLFMIALGLALLYAGCRARFVFVESVIHDRFAVREPWARLRVPGLSLFKARLLLSFAFGLIPVVGLVLAGFVAWPDVVAGHFGSAALLAALIAGAGTLLWLPGALLLAVIDDFVVPLMYLEGVGVLEGWRRFRARVLPNRALDLLLFYGLKIALAVGAGMVAALASCFTCFVAALPYVSTVVLLPYHVLMQAFSLYALELFGVHVFPLVAPAPYWQPSDERFR